MDVRTGEDETVIVEARQEVGAGVRATVVERLATDPDLKAILATSLGVPTSSVEKMIEQEFWDLDLGLTVANLLRIPLRVSHG